MTNAQFCDVHPDQATSLIRGDKTSVTTLVLQTAVKEVDENGKKVTWTRETKIHACAKCAQELILKRVQALGIELEYDEYRLVNNNGKYSRVNRSTEESEAEPTPLAK